jgi:hypothetical protein
MTTKLVLFAILAVLAAIVTAQTTTPVPSEFTNLIVKAQTFSENYNYGSNGDGLSQVKTLLDNLVQNMYNHEADLETSENIAYAKLTKAIQVEKAAFDWLEEVRKRVYNFTAVGQLSQKKMVDEQQVVQNQTVVRREVEKTVDTTTEETKKVFTDNPDSPQVLCEIVTGVKDCKISQNCANCYFVSFNFTHTYSNRHAITPQLLSNAPNAKKRLANWALKSPLTLSLQQNQSYQVNLPTLPNPPTNHVKTADPPTNLLLLFAPMDIATYPLNPPLNQQLNQLNQWRLNIASVSSLSPLRRLQLTIAPSAHTNVKKTKRAEFQDWKTPLSEQLPIPSPRTCSKFHPTPRTLVLNHQLVLNAELSSALFFCLLTSALVIMPSAAELTTVMSTLLSAMVNIQLLLSPITRVLANAPETLKTLPTF